MIKLIFCFQIIILHSCTTEIATYMVYPKTETNNDRVINNWWQHAVLWSTNPPASSSGRMNDSHSLAGFLKRINLFNFEREKADDTNMLGYREPNVNQRKWVSLKKILREKIVQRKERPWMTDLRQQPLFLSRCQLHEN